MHGAQKSQSARNDDIEILRAYAVLLVLYEHFPAVTGFAAAEKIRHFMNGWTGVDLFFCISGFVIYRSISASLTFQMSPTEAIRRIAVFWIRRFWRLAPAASLWLALGIPAILTYKSAEIGSVSTNVADGISALINVENFHRYACNTLNDVCGRLFPAYWSLSLEAQFYVLLPVALVLLRRRWVTIGLIGLILVQFPLNRPANGVDLAWFIRTDAIAWGVLLAQFSESTRTGLIEPLFLQRSFTRFCYTFGLIWLLGSSQILWRLPFFVGLAAAVSACLVWAASYDRGYISRALGGGKVLRWIGHRSFSLYVSHMIVFKATRQILQSLGVYDFTTPGKFLYLAIAYTGTFTAAALTYRLVEQPLRRRGRDYARGYLERTAAPIRLEDAEMPGVLRN